MLRKVIMQQKRLWRESEGDRWLERNREALQERTEDPVLETLNLLKLVPRRIFEIGCSNGWRLELLGDYFDASSAGIEPSPRAVAEARMAGRNVQLGTADDLSGMPDRYFDLVIYSWVLCLCDRGDLARIVAEADRVLAPGGSILIHEPSVDVPYRNVWKHDTRLWCYKMNYAVLWGGNPNYTLLYHRVYDVDLTDERTAISVVYKLNLTE